MRILQGIVGVEAVVLVVLFALLAQRGDVAPPSPAQAAMAAQSGNAAAAATGGVASDLNTERAAPNERVRVDTGTAAGDGAVVLQGRLLGLDAPPRDGAVSLTCSRDGAYRSANTRDGVYAIAGMSPGVWRVRCKVEGCVLQQFEHTLDASPIQRLDLTLVPAVVLPVFVRTTEGKRLQAELSKLDIWQSMQVIATATPLPGDLAPTEHSSVGDFGLGRHRVSADVNQRADEDGGDGVLELDQAPPVCAALLLRHLLLAQQTIVPGQRELRFEVDLASVLARLARLRLAVRNANGQPVAQAMIRLSSAQGGGSARKTASDGAVDIENVLPGLNQLEIWAKDQERYVDHLTLPAGATTDLGDILLTASRTVSGRTVDVEGHPLRGSVQWTPIDLWRPPHPMQDNRTTSADGDGNFALPLGARRYIVKASTAEGLAGYTIVDVRTATAAPIVIALRTATTVHLDVVGDPLATYAVVVRSPAGDLLDAERIEPRWRQKSLSLPSGEYVFEVYDGAGGFVRRAQLHVGSEALRVEVP